MMMRNIEKADLVPGAVLRMVFHDGSVEPFSDCVIESVSEDEITFVRPYAHLVSDSAFISGERFNASISRLTNKQGMFRAVLNDRGSLYMMKW